MNVFFVNNYYKNSKMSGAHGTLLVVWCTLHTKTAFCIPWLPIIVVPTFLYILWSLNGT